MPGPSLPHGRAHRCALIACSSRLITPDSHDACHWTVPACCSIRRRTSLVSSIPLTRRARGNARRRSARSRHPVRQCNQAPLPGSVPWMSGTQTIRPSFRTTTTRSRSDLAARIRQPTQVRTGPPRRSATSPEPASPAPTAPATETLGHVYGQSSVLAADPAGTSGWMSMRHPVRRAASRAFCPSLPMARESW